MSEHSAREIRTVRFHAYGEPCAVLRLENTTLAFPAPGRVRIRVQACGLNPADWALCRGLFAGKLPRGIGLEAAGIVDALGDDVSDAKVGQAMFGPVDFAETASAGASDYAILQHWTPVPDGLDPNHAAALPMAVAIAYGSLDCFGVGKDTCLMVNGAGTTVGFAAVQIARLRGARVIASAGATFKGQLEAIGAEVVPYGDGLAERVAQLGGRNPDVVLDTAPLSDALPALVKISGDPQRVMTISDFAAAKKLNVRTNLGDPKMRIRYDVLGDYAALAQEGRFSIPISKAFPLSAWEDAMRLSESQQARGKIILMPQI